MRLSVCLSVRSETETAFVIVVFFETLETADAATEEMSACHLRLIIRLAKFFFCVCLRLLLDASLLLIPLARLSH